MTERIKERIDIVEFIRQYTEVKPAGRNFKANCPFHRERTPSFMISPERQSWHCFGGCNEGGDVFAFLMKYENIEFPEALKILASRAGVELADYRGENREAKAAEALYKVNEAAKNIFKKSFSPEAAEYLLSRGLKKSTIAEWELGYTPSKGSFLADALLKLGFETKDIEGAGLAFPTRRGLMDRFRERVMFPISDERGRVVGFTGRILKETQRSDGTPEAKYVNTPETLAYKKSRILYGYHKSKPHVKDWGYVMIVEGQMDVLMSYQDGVKNVVASSGTALTLEQLRILKKMTDKILLGFDMDAAGQKAAERSIDLAHSLDFAVKVISFSGKDPAEMVKEAPGELKKKLKEAVSTKEYFFAKYLSSDIVQDEKKKKEGLTIILSRIQGLASAIDQEEWYKEVAARTGVSLEALKEEVKRLAKDQVKDESFYDEVKQKESRDEGVTDRRLFLMARVKDLGGELIGEEVEDLSRLSEKDLLQATYVNGSLGEDERKMTLVMLEKLLAKDRMKRQLFVLRGKIRELEERGGGEELMKKLKEFERIKKTVK